MLFNVFQTLELRNRSISHRCETNYYTIQILFRCLIRKRFLQSCSGFAGAFRRCAGPSAWCDSGTRTWSRGSDTRAFLTPPARWVAASQGKTRSRSPARDSSFSSDRFGKLSFSLNLSLAGKLRKIHWPPASSLYLELATVPTDPGKISAKNNTS